MSASFLPLINPFFIYFSFYWQTAVDQKEKKNCVIIRSECSFVIMSKTFFLYIVILEFNFFFRKKYRKVEGTKKQDYEHAGLCEVQPYTHHSWYLEQFSQLITGAMKDGECSNAFKMILKNNAHPPSNLKGNSLVISTHPQGYTHSAAYQSIVYNGSRIIQLAQGLLMILEIKEDNTFSVPPSLLPLGAMFLFNQVAVEPQVLQAKSLVCYCLWLFINLRSAVWQINRESDSAV